MVLQRILIRTRLAVDAALGPLRSASTRQNPRTKLKLDDLENRVLLSAVPAAMITETLDAAPVDTADQTFDHTAGDLSQQDATVANAAEAESNVGQAPPDKTETDVWEDSGIRQAQPDLQAAEATDDSSGSRLSESNVGQAPPDEMGTDADAPSTGDNSTTDAARTDAADVRHELVFVDASVRDYQQLVEDLQSHDNGSRQLDVRLLTGDRDGVDQISETLAAYDDLDAVHIVSHGTDGKVKLGDIWLDVDNLDGYAGQIAGWQDALRSDADLLFYGCDLAASENGQALVDSLSALTGADVAASVDDTGHADLGGDWELEFHTGPIETQIAVSADGQSAWNHVLALPTYVGNSTLAASTGTITPALPAGIQAGDVLLAFFETHQETVTIANPNGGTWTQVPNSPQGSGGSGWNSSSRITVFWSVYNGTQGAPTTNDPGDHVSGFIAAFRGVDTSNPIDVTSGSSGDTDVLSIPGATTTVNDTLLVIAATSEDDADSFSNWTNASVANLTERLDAVHAQGDEGHIGMATGEKAMAGAYVASAVTQSGPDSGQQWGGMTIALAPASVNMLTVDTTSDVSDGDTSSIMALLADKGADGFVSLREAILATNNTVNGATPDEIHFNIAGAGPHTIQPTSALPFLTESVIVDGWSEPDFAGTPVIELDGTGAGAGVDGLTISANGSTVRGLVINRFAGMGIAIASDNNSIQGNYIGTDVTGALDRGNLNDGIRLDGNASNNTIGGTVAAERNVISGNDGHGVHVLGPVSTGNVVLGNYIGVDSTATTTLGNTLDGVKIQLGAAANTVGGTAANAGNVIGGNRHGVFLENSNTDNNVIQGNLIGTNSSGANLGNTSHGILVGLDVGSTTIGGTAAGAGNTIAFNTSAGIGTSDVPGPTGIEIRGNSIHSNGLLGIDLTDDGVTANDPGDADGGHNLQQNYPVPLYAFASGGNTTVVYSLNSTSGTTFDIDFYSSSAADPSGFGEGEVYRGNAQVTTDGAGNAATSTLLGTALSVGDVVTLTATDPSGNTSEFSVQVTVQDYWTLVVDTTSDVADGDTSSIAALLADKGADGFISLREAITATNNTPNGASPDEIRFDIAGAGPHTIAVSAGGLPIITEAVVIDGYTQTGAQANTVASPGASDAVLRIELDGSGAGVGTDGLTLASTVDGATIRGLVINRFDGFGVWFNGADNSTIEGNYIGTDTTGLADLGNNSHGVYLETGSTGNTIGGTSPGARNLISGNNQSGVVAANPNAANNFIQGNYIGTDVTGNVALGNTFNGVWLLGPNNTVGGTAAGAGNVISGNGSAGIYINWGTGTGNVVQGNLIGTNAAGNADLGNTGVGVYIESANNTIGGTTAAARNVISGNDSFGVRIGTSAATGNVIQGNFIGTDAGNTLNLTNSDDGIVILAGASGNTIGGTAAGAGNTIAYNNDGITVDGATTVNNAILGNSIRSSGALGIDLSPNNVTPNDLGDADTGPNNLQNFPVLEAAVSSGGNTTITGWLNSNASTTYRIEFFSSPVGHVTGYGEGETYLGSVNVTTDANGYASFSPTLIGVAVATGDAVSATATVDLGGGNYGDTSEFAANVLNNNTANLTAAQDTYIYKDSPALNYGVAPSLIVDRSGGGYGKRLALLQFDLTVLPAGATITGATLQMEATQNGGAFNLNVYELTQSWVEGSGNGTPDAANWTERLTGTNWTAPGSDFDPTVIATLNTGAIGQHTWDVTPLVQDWYTGSKVNNGLIIGSRDTGTTTVTYDSSEGAIPPQLLITYTLASNTAPVLDNSKSPVLTGESEDAGAPVGAVGTLVSSLVDFAIPAGQVDNVTDPDAGALLGVAVTATDTANGTWHYSIDGGSNWNPLGAVADNSARRLAADANTRIYFQPNPDYNGTLPAAITFRAWDRTSGMNGTLADTTVNGGSTAYSTATDVAALTVDAVNDAPVVTAPGGPLAATEQIGLAIHGTGFGVSDVDEAGAGAVATLSVGEGTITVAQGDSGVTVTGGNGTGTVTLSGTVAQINNLLTAAGTGTITYFNGSDTPSASTTLTVTVNDQGHTGTDPGLTGDGSSEEGTNNVTINITAVNDDPTNAGSLPTDIAVTEDVLSDVDLSLLDLNDVDAAAGNLTVTLTTSTGGDLSATSGGGITVGGSGTGTLTLTGTQAALNTFLNTASNVQYLHGTTHTNGNDADTIQVDVTDNGNTGTGGGGTITLGTVNVDISAVNDAPINSVPGPQVTAEDTALIFSSAGGNAITVSDVDAGSNPVIVTLTATNGTLTLGSTTGLTFGTGDGDDDPMMSFAGTIAEINNALEGLRFDPTPDYNGPATIDITVDDQGNVGSGGAKTDLDTVNITVTPVNDDPVVSDATFAIDEHRPAGTPVGTVVASDVDIGDSLTYRITGGTGNGVFGIDPATGEVFVVDPAELVYEANPSFGLTVQVEDLSGATDSASVTIQLVNINLPPNATDDVYTMDRVGVLTIAAPGVLANDSDPEGDPLAALLVGGPSHGGLSLGADGALQYTPGPDFVTTDSFTYRTTDGLEQSNPATVTIELIPWEPPPDDPPGDDPDDGGDDDSQDDGTDDDSSDTDGETPAEDGSDSEDPGTPGRPHDDDRGGVLMPLVDELPEQEPIPDATDPSTAWAKGPARRADAAWAPSGQEGAQPTPETDIVQQEYGTLWHQLDAFRQDLNEELASDNTFDTIVVGGTALTVTGLTVGYVLWLIRGGTLLASVLSTLPAWCSLDPLPVLDRFDGDRHCGDEPNDDSLATMVSRQNQSSTKTETGQER